MNRRGIPKKLLIGMVFLSVFCFSYLPQTSAQTRLAIIAHPGVSQKSIRRTQLADIFMKKTRSWPDGSTIRPVDMGDGTTQRRIFLSAILHRSEREMIKYWIGQKLYTGDYAPLKLESEDAVIHFVATVRGSVGYVVSASPERLRQVKILTVTE